MHIFYISGLGDRYDGFRAACLHFWDGKFGVKVTHVPMRWRDASETAEQKLDRISRATSVTTREVVLIGESAGASAAFVSGSRLERVSRVVTLCGKTIHAERVGSSIYQKNSAFRDMMELADKANRDRKITSEKVDVIALQAIGDQMVRPVDMAVDAVRYRRLPSFGHFFAIVTALTVLWPYVIAVAKHK